MVIQCILILEGRNGYKIPPFGKSQSRAYYTTEMTEILHKHDYKITDVKV